MSVPQVCDVYCWILVYAGWPERAASFMRAIDTGSAVTTVAAVSRPAITVRHSGSIVAGARSAMERYTARVVSMSSALAMAGLLIATDCVCTSPQ